MKFVIALLCLVATSFGQTYRTVTANTNDVIRTNFTMSIAQVSGAMATNGSAAGLTNFPASLLRTNGDGSGLTNLPNANLTNATGILAISKGGTGATNASLAISNLLPSYTGNSNRILALNSNATELQWTTNAGGGGGGGTTYSNSEEAMNGLFFASSNNNSINLFVNGGTNFNSQHTVIGSGASAFGTNVTWEAVVIGAVAEVTNGGVSVGSYATAAHGISIGFEANSAGRSTAVGIGASASGGAITGTNQGSVAVGAYATVLTNHGVAIGATAQSDNRGVAVGRSAYVQSTTNTRSGTAVGYDSQANSAGVAVGDNAIAGNGVSIGAGASSELQSIAIGENTYVDPFINAIQIGTGSNFTDNTIQFFNAGTITTNTLKALSDSTTFGHYILAAPTNGTNGQVLVLNSNATAVIWTNVSGGGASYPSFTNNASKVLAVTTNETGVEWIAVSNTVTDASTLTNFPSNLLRTNGSANGLTNFPTLNQNTTGTASNVTGVVAISNGGTGSGTTNGALTNFGILLSDNRVRIGEAATATGFNTTVLGDGASTSFSNSIAIGYLANAATIGGIAIGRSSSVQNSRSIAIGDIAAVAAGVSNSVQLGNGTNTNNNTIQFLSAGSIDTNEWVRIAALSTYPTTNIQVTVVGGATNTLIFSNGILTSVTTP